MDKNEKILRLLEENAHFTHKNIADAVGLTEAEVDKIIEDYEEQGVILGYKALINWDKTSREYVSAIIEIKVQPIKGEGFTQVARQICAFPEVVSCYLMSGGFDLAVTLEGKSMKEVAMFVFEKLSVIEGVTGTATHFVLNKYKDKELIFETQEKDDRQMMEL